MISFVIPAHNEEALLGCTIRTIHQSAKSAGEPYEIIVANDDSTDATAEIASSLGAKVIDVKLRHIAAVRNAGSKHATGELLIFVDADTKVTPESVQQAIAAVKAGAIAGAARAAFDGPLPFSVKVASGMFFRGIYLLGMATGCFFFVTRDAFARIGGFDERYYTAEDCQLAKDLRKHGRFVLLKATVLTSGRKMRAYTPWQLATTFGRIVFRGKRAMMDKKGLEFWYNAPREGERPAQDDCAEARPAVQA